MSHWQLKIERRSMDASVKNVPDNMRSLGGEGAIVGLWKSDEARSDINRAVRRWRL